MAFQKSNPEWFTREIPCCELGQPPDSFEIWYQFLNFQFIYFIPRNEMIIVTFYQPNLVARQFGLSQVLPCPSLNLLKQPMGVSDLLKCVA